MHEHVAHRLAHALGKLQSKDDAATKQRRTEAQEKYKLVLILERGVRIADQIAVASHVAKGIHPDLHVKKTTNLAVDFSSLPSLAVVGSHVLSQRDGLHDTTGNGPYNSAAYELYLLLECRFEGQKLIDLLRLEDRDAIEAVNSAAQLDNAAALCIRLLEPKCTVVSANTLIKQLYWLSGGDACNDAHYTLLAPLYATSLAHAVHAPLQEDRFGEANEAARQARRERKMHDGVFHSYPGLAVEYLGGVPTNGRVEKKKALNISYLNGERGGMNYLLSSLPPQWKVTEQRFPSHTKSVFARYFDSRPLVRQTVKALQRYLETDPDPVKGTRDHRKELVDVLVDEMVNMAAELQHALAPGWTLNDPRFSKLNEDEQTWLDALRAELPEEEDFANRWLAMKWPDAIGTSFGNWLNARLEGKLSFSDIEFREWKKELLTDEDGFSQQLRERRKRIRAARKGGQP